MFGADDAVRQSRLEEYEQEQRDYTRERNQQNDLKEHAAAPMKSAWIIADACSGRVVAAALATSRSAEAAEQRDTSRIGEQLSTQK
jgi:hypothetical protein